MKIRVEGEIGSEWFWADIDLPDEFWLRHWAGLFLASGDYDVTYAVREADALLAEFKKREAAQVTSKGPDTPTGQETGTRATTGPRKGLPG